jgi:serine/threonine protein kinase
VYEFLPNGSLRDHLVACKNGSMPPLKWQVCIKIIREIWMVLTFLHSSKPPLVHGNLKPSKVLLGPNFTCKLEASSIISQSNGTPTAATEHHDLHSFGSIALQLLMTRLC